MCIYIYILITARVDNATCILSPLSVFFSSNGFLLSILVSSKSSVFTLGIIGIMSYFVHFKSQIAKMTGYISDQNLIQGKF